MFVAELDRPWAETPFLLQGFQLTDATHLASLRDFVREVTIDPLRSTTDSLAHLPWDALHDPIDLPETREATAPPPVGIASDAPSPMPSPATAGILCELWRSLRGGSHAADDARLQPYFLRYADAPDALRQSGQTDATNATNAERSTKLTPPSTPQFSRFIASLYPQDVNLRFGLRDAFGAWRAGRRRKQLAAAGGKPARAPDLRRPRDRPDYLPEGMPLYDYRDQAPIEVEMVRAQQVVANASIVLEKIVSDIRADLPVDIDTVKPIVAVLVDSVISNPAALMWSTRMRDESKKTYLHGLKVAIYMMALGRHLGFPKEQLSELGSIGLLLDIGMLKIPKALLDKAGQLTPAEAGLLKRHVSYSIAALQQSEPLPPFVARGILEHHERIDGSGYPRSLRGADISVYGRMAAIADTFAAMTTARAYDVTHSAFDAMKELFREAETKLHGPLVEQFVQAISIFPVGSLIELTTGEAAIVIEHNGVRRLEPKVLVLTDAEKELLAQPYPLELMGRNPERKKILRGLADGSYGIDYRDYYLS